MHTRYYNIREMLEGSAVKYSLKTAFKIKTDKGYRCVTYRELKEEADALASFLVKNGYNKKRVAVIGENSYGWILAFLAVLSAGGIIVPLDRGLLEHELDEQLSRAEAELVFCSSTFYENLKERTGCRAIQINSEEFNGIIEGGKTADKTEYLSIDIDSSKMSILLFTSGTTAKSKAVMLSQNNILSNVYGLSLWEKFEEDDISMALLPFHHAFGMVQTVLFLSLGICNVFCEGLRVAKCLTEYGVTVFVAVPLIVDEIKNTIFRKLRKENKLGLINMLNSFAGVLNKMHIDIRRKMFSQIIDKLGGGLRLIIVGAAAANPDTLNWLNNIGVLTIQGYGLSETSPVVSAENESNMKLGSVGKALPGIDVKIVNPDEKGLGEIAVRGENVMLGYYGDEAATEAVMDGEYFLTGDIGRLDKDGYIFITGRKKNVIVLHTGKNVFPEEIEALLDQCDAIKECVVYNSQKGGRDCISAKIVYDINLEREDAENQIVEHINKVNRMLIDYKQIKEWDITDVEMEKTTTKKIKRANI